MVTLEVFNPCGAVGTTKLHHAPRLPELSGKTVCELSNGLWEDNRTFPLIRELLRKQFPDTNFVPYTEFPVGHVKIDVDDIGEIIAKKGCQAVIGGNAG